MRKEITFGAITGLLFGSTLIAPVAVYRTEASVPIRTNAPAPLVLPKLPAETPLADYSFIDERNLFQPAISPELPKPKLIIKLPDFNVAPPWVSPLEGWVYAGYFTLDGETQAILQQSEGEASFVKLGDNFLGGQVQEITPERVRLSFGAEQETILTKSDVFNAVPLETKSKSAARPAANPAGRPAAFRPGAPARLQPINRIPAGTSGNLPGGANPSVQERAAALRAQWEARRQAREEALRQSPTLPAPSTPNAGR